MTESLWFIATVTALGAAVLRYLTVLQGRSSPAAIEVATAQGFFAGLLISVVGLYLIES